MTRKENKKIIKLPGDKMKVYCQEEYAQSLYDFMNGIETVNKDITAGDILKVVELKVINNEVEILCDNFDTLYFEISKERKYFEMLGLTQDSFTEWANAGNFKNYCKTHNIYALVENKEKRKGSLYAAHLKTIADEFKKQISNPTLAYNAKILSKNQGGFLVEVQGIKAFLPGSLAAANKIVNFDDYLGKTVNVMIEDYLVPSNIFVVSYKKYLEYVLPSKLSQLERNQTLKGTVTGTSKFGIFAEFNDIFTGLLHSSEMNPETLQKFTNGEFKSGSEITAWLKDIKDNKLILTENDPMLKQNELENLRTKVEGEYRISTIVSIKNHGALLEIEKGVVGLLPIKEMKKTGKKLNVGDSLEVFIKRVDTSTNKIYLTISEEVEYEDTYSNSSKS